MQESHRQCPNDLSDCDNTAWVGHNTFDGLYDLKVPAMRHMECPVLVKKLAPHPSLSSLNTRLLEMLNKKKKITK